MVVSNASPEPLIVLDKVNKFFGDLHVLRDVDLSVARGEVVVVIGPSGSGKSTLCRAINRLETINSGQITFDGSALPAEGRALARLRSDVGMVFQSFNLFAHKSILQNVTLGPIKVRKEKPDEARKRGLALLERVGIAEPGRQIPGPAVRRPAAARGDRASAGDAAQGDALRRADQRTRPRDGRRGARGDDVPRP